MVHTIVGLVPGVHDGGCGYVRERERGYGDGDGDGRRCDDKDGPGARQVYITVVGRSGQFGRFACWGVRDVVVVGRGILSRQRENGVV
jgi:hypothetical protein